MDDVGRERFERIAKVIRRRGVRPRSYEAWREAFERVLADHPPGRDLWVFGFGSLLWNPGVELVERRKARLRGFERRFCLRDPLGRGSPERPGVMLAIRPGSSCQGLAFRIESSRVRDELLTLWTREMVGGGYLCRWVELESDAGELRAITFVIDPRSPGYVGDLSLDETAQILARAEGILGSGREYLENTVERLESMGIRDEHLLQLRERVRALVEPA